MAAAVNVNVSTLLVRMGPNGAKVGPTVGQLRAKKNGIAREK